MNIQKQINNDLIVTSCDPLISVVMSVFKEPIEWLRQSIDSILNQTFRDFEFIIICDNPKYQDAIELLKEYQNLDSRIIIIQNSSNIGLTSSLNKGINTSKGKYIARMDADDISMPERFERQLDIFKNKNIVDICGSNVMYIGDITGSSEYPENDEDMIFYVDNCMAHSSVMMKREVAKIQYNEKWTYGQDYELWYRAKSKGYVFYNIQDCLLKYRFSKSQISTSRNKDQTYFSRTVRRAFFDLYCKKNDFVCRMGETPVSFELIDTMIRSTDIGDKMKSKIIYYLLLSIVGHTFLKIKFIYSRGYSKLLSMRFISSILYHSVRKDRIYMY